MIENERLQKVADYIHKLEDRIKELEEQNRDLRVKNEYLQHDIDTIISMHDDGIEF